MVQKITPDFNGASEFVPAGNKRLEHLPACFADYADMAVMEKTGCGAVTIGTVPDPENFSSGVGDEPVLTDFIRIKRAGSGTYHIPRLFTPYEKTIEIIAEDQAVRSPNVFNKHAFLLIHRSLVRTGHFQRNDDWHCDTLPESLARQYDCNRNGPHHFYLVSDRVPTVVQSRAVENARNIFKCHGGAEITAPHSRQLDPYEIILMNDYVYHRGVVAKEPCMRNFMVMMYAPGPSFY